MIDIENSGYLVKTKDGKYGRTYHKNGLVNGKVAVYLASKSIEVDGDSFPLIFSENGILCDKSRLTYVGFID